MALNEILLILAGIILGFSTMFTKKVVMQGLVFNSFVVGLIATGLIGGILMFYSLKQFPLWKVSLFVGLITAITSILLSYFFLKETITPTQLVLIVIGIIVLGLLGFVGKV